MPAAVPTSGAEWPSDTELLRRHVAANRHLAPRAAELEGLAEAIDQSETAAANPELYPFLVAARFANGSLADALVAKIRYEQGRIDEAEDMVFDRLPILSTAAMLDCVLAAYVVLVRLAGCRSNRAGLGVGKFDAIRNHRQRELHSVRLRVRERLGQQIGLAYVLRVHVPIDASVSFTGDADLLRSAFLLRQSLHVERHLNVLVVGQVVVDD